MTDNYENDKLYRALVNALWYNVGLEAIENLYNKLNALTEKDYSISYRDIDEDWYWDKELNTYWTMFVEMFGECGTSPRSGWLFKTPESLNFFKNICDDLKELGD